MYNRSDISIGDEDMAEARPVITDVWGNLTFDVHGDLIQWDHDGTGGSMLLNF